MALPDVIILDSGIAPPLGAYGYVNKQSVMQVCKEFEAATGRILDKVFVRTGNLPTIFVLPESDDELKRLCK